MHSVRFVTIQNGIYLAMLVFQQSVEQSSLAACSKNTVTTQAENTSSHTLKSKKSEEESDTRNESVRSHKEIIKEEDKVIPHISGTKTIAAKETEKRVKCSTNQEIVERQREESRLLENIMCKEQIWPMHGEVKLVQTVHKPPHLRSKVSIVPVIQFTPIFKN
jgi:flagellar biosynthesis GTPase FlhF